MAEVAPGPFEQAGGWRVMQVDVHVVRENELDVAQGIQRPRPLAQTPFAATHRFQGLIADGRDNAAGCRDELEALAVQIIGVAPEPGYELAPCYRNGNIPVRAELDEAHV